MMTHSTSNSHVNRFIGLMTRLLHDRRGNVLMIVGLSIVPLVFATGMGIDYSRAMRLQTRLNAAADAAALAAVTKPMMSKTSAQACAAAKNMFVAQAANLTGLVIDTNNVNQLHITITDSASKSSAGTVTECSNASSATAASYSRTASVTYKGLSQNAFAGVLGLTTLPIHGSSQTNAAVAPDIDFYLMLDVSGSMALPAFSDGLAKITSSLGCAFACHEYDPNNDGAVAVKTYDLLHNPIDHYTWAHNQGISLRIDEMKKAVTNLTAVASSTASNNKATYQMSVSTFSEANTFKTIFPLNSSYSSVPTLVNSIDTPSYCTNSNIPVLDSNGNPKYNNGKMVCTGNNDQGTASSDAFTKLKAMLDKLPAPGDGIKPDKPEQVIFLITDGMRDENRPSNQPEVKFDYTLCNALKLDTSTSKRLIAVLYTEYLPSTIANDAWSTQTNQGNVYNRLPLVEPALQQCASSTLLYYKVSTDDDISAALNNLFQKAVASATIIQ